MDVACLDHDILVVHILPHNMVDVHTLIVQYRSAVVDYACEFPSYNWFLN